MYFAVFFLDRFALEEPEKVDKIQWNLIENLKYIFRKNGENPECRMWKIFDKFSLLRNVTEIGQEANKIRSKWPVMKEHPLVLEMIKNPDDPPGSA